MISLLVSFDQKILLNDSIITRNRRKRTDNFKKNCLLDYEDIFWIIFDKTQFEKKKSKKKSIKNLLFFLPCTWCVMCLPWMWSQKWSDAKYRWRSYISSNWPRAKNAYVLRKEAVTMPIRQTDTTTEYGLLWWPIKMIRIVVLHIIGYYCFPYTVSIK